MNSNPCEFGWHPTVQLLDRGDRDVGKDQLFFPIKRWHRGHYALTQFCVRAFLNALASEASLGTLIKARLSDGIPLPLANELRHIDPKARIERWDTLDRLSKRRYDSLEKEF